MRLLPKMFSVSLRSKPFTAPDIIPHSRGYSGIKCQISADFNTVYVDLNTVSYSNVVKLQICAVQPTKCITRRSITVHSYFGAVMVSFFSNFNSINLEPLLRVRHTNPLHPTHQNNAEHAV